MRFVMSYARSDLDRVRAVVEGVRRLHHEVWFDQELEGGDVWWDKTLARIRDCDGLLVALSESELRSVACQREQQYARALGKSLLPVQVKPFPANLLPPDLAGIQVVDYTADGAAAFTLAAAVAQVPPAPALPAALPSPPPPPVSYLAELSKRVQEPALTLDEELTLISKLDNALDHPGEFDAATELLTQMRARSYLYAASAEAIVRALARAAEIRRRQSVTTPEVPATPLPVEPAYQYGQRSPDGRYWWNGTTWVAVPQTAAKDTMGSGLAVVTVLGLIFFPPAGLLTIWLTRWSMTTKVVLAVLDAVWFFLGLLVLSNL